MTQILEQFRMPLALAAWILAACMGVAFCASVALALLPAPWVGSPYIELIRWMNPRMDSPDLWALAFISMITIAGVLCLSCVASIVAALYLHPFQSRARRAPNDTVQQGIHA